MTNHWVCVHAGNKTTFMPSKDWDSKVEKGVNSRPSVVVYFELDNISKITNRLFSLFVLLNINLCVSVVFCKILNQIESNLNETIDG